MEAKTIIPAFTDQRRQTEEMLNISEFYYDTIQGEGIHLGHPAAFLRLKGCVLDCEWCDTKDVWTRGSSFSHSELFLLMEKHGIVDKLTRGQHLVITGGSPLLQQKQLVAFLKRFENAYDFMPFVEVENECVIMPTLEMTSLVCCWNNSPKLSNSGVPLDKRYKPDVIQHMGRLEDSWFKFVISRYCDWDEIAERFIHPGFIAPYQIILMPEGSTREELAVTTQIAIELAIREGVLYRGREHIALWGKRVGI